MKGAFFMLQHFSYKPMYENSQLPGWIFSFYYRSKRVTGEYFPDGEIKWTSEVPNDEEQVKKMIHELMTFHVYE